MFPVPWSGIAQWVLKGELGEVMDCVPFVVQCDGPINVGMLSAMELMIV